MFTQSAEIYDAIYHFKDYAAEVERLHDLIQQHMPEAKTLLDVACGTGKHLEHLRAFYQVEGLDLNKELLKVARKRLPQVRFHHANMTDFNLGRSFDAITCLFSSIGYVKTVANLQRSVMNMASHLKPEGVLIVEPWFTPGAFIPDTVHASFVDEPELKIARMNVSKVEGRISVMEMHYLVGTLEGIEHFSERHELAMFTHKEYLQSFQTAGLEVHFDSQGLSGRGLYVGVKGL